LALLSGCSKPKTSESPPEPGDVAVAKVNDMAIWASDVRQEAVAQGEIGEGEPLDITSDLFHRTLEDVIDRRLMAEEAHKKGLDNSLVAQRRLQAAHDRILADMLVENTINRAINEDKVKALYDEQVRLSQKSEEIRARLIILKTKEEAESVFKALQGGAIFEALAMERSIDQSTRFNGGDMGYFTTDMMPQAFKGAMGNAQPGTLIGPVESDGGWAILRVEDRRPEQPQTLEDLRPQIVRFLTFDQLRGLLIKMREKAKVDYLIERKGPNKKEDFEPASAPKGASSETAQAEASASSPSSSSASSSVKSAAKP
jgi:peptidyl-prolyl cis-trans isomerase C